MPRRPENSTRHALTAVRIAAALLILLHGVARASLGIVDDFGEFLNGQGFPAGHVLAWLITILEVAGGALLAAGRWVRPIALYFTAQLLVGISLIHVHHGWFTVGAGRNGMEYSVLLIAVLLAVAYASAGQARVQEQEVASDRAQA